MNCGDKNHIKLRNLIKNVNVLYFKVLIIRVLMLVFMLSKLKIIRLNLYKLICYSFFCNNRLLSTYFYSFVLLKSLSNKLILSL